MKSNEDNADKQKRDVRLAMLFSVTALVASAVVVWLIRMRILPAAYLFTAQVGMAGCRIPMAGTGTTWRPHQPSPTQSPHRCLGANRRDSVHPDYCVPRLGRVLA